MHDADLKTVHIDRNFSIGQATPPTLSVVVPCYNVADHIPRLLESIDAQDCAVASVELIFVIDGSPDDTETIIAKWMASSRFSVTLVVQENRGVGGALNTGNRLSRGELINTTGGDDSFESNYFSEILRANRTHPEISIYVSKLIRISATGDQVRHSLDFKFTGVTENSIVDLRSQPEMIHLAGGVLTLRRRLLEKFSLEYNEKLRATFEDAELIARYLLRLEEPKYLLLPNAHYYYWARDNSLTSGAQDLSGRLFSGKLLAARYGYRRLLDEAGKHCPQWLGNVILYDLYWTFSAHMSLNTSVYALTKEEKDEYASLSREYLRRIGIQTIQQFRVVTLTLDVRAAWEAAAAPDLMTHAPVRWKYDKARELQKVTFYSNRDAENTSVSCRGALISTPIRHVREIIFFGEAWAYEHIYWLDVNNLVDWRKHLRFTDPSCSISFFQDGKVFGFRELQVELNAYSPELPPLDVERKKTLRKSRATRRKRSIERLNHSLSYRIGGKLGWRKKFHNAWVLIDGADQANDNAEHLYRYLRRHRPDINAWFVITRDSPDWKRLNQDGFRLIAFRSRKHFALMKECKVLASSSADQDPTLPFRSEYLPKTWTFSFLQHGVTKDRMDRWLNRKEIDHFVTSTEAETSSISQSPSPYKFSAREVTLTGMPRHDRLQELCERNNKEGGTKRVLVMPTWRAHLSRMIKSQGVTAVAQSSYIREWTSFLTGHGMESLTSNPDVEVYFLPHRSSEIYWNDLSLPASVKRVAYLRDDIQAILASTSLVVTDYSSQAFEGAFCGAPSVYFQFDRDSFFSGGHATLPGYFDYRRDGFGPVTESVDSTFSAIDQMLHHTHPNYDSYMERVEHLYPLRDGRASERVVAEIEKRLTPYS